MRRVKGTCREDDLLTLLGGGGDDTHTVLYHPVAPSDTIAGIALKYRTTVCAPDGIASYVDFLFAPQAGFL